MIRSIYYSWFLLPRKETNYWDWWEYSWYKTGDFTR